jgi:hypothetical protein
MGSLRPFAPTRLVVGLLHVPLSGALEAATRALEARLGPADRRGPDLPFPWSDYYDEEMGARPSRSFLSFPRLVDPAELAGIKTWTNSIELDLADGGSGGGRPANLDPGLLSLTRFVLATTKDRPHRIPLSEGIYAETTLVYEAGDYMPLPWTYPDWASEPYRALLRELRARLKEDIAEKRGRPRLNRRSPPRA